jgi:uncharacterized membrane protein
MSSNQTIDRQEGAPVSLLPFADRVRLVHTDAPFRWLAAGWNDFRRARGLSAAYACVFVAAGFVLMAGLTLAGMEYLIVPLTAGFLLVGPALTVGFYAISRDLDEGREPSFASCFQAWRANPPALFAMGLAMLVFLVVWLRFAALVFALSYPDIGFDWERVVSVTFFTKQGLGFLAFGTAVGAVMATIAFMAGAFSLPLMLDRRVGLLEAVVTSLVAVVLNARAMAVWAGLVVLFTGAGLAAWYVGLCITLPLIGHATWHAYRDVIRPH